MYCGKRYSAIWICILMEGELIIMAQAKICDLCKKFYDPSKDEDRAFLNNKKISFIRIYANTGNDTCAPFMDVDLCKECFHKAFENLYQEGEK